MSEHNLNKLISVREAMDLMAVGRTTFYSEVKKGNITLKRFGARKSLVPLESVINWIDSLPTVGGDDE